MTELNPYRRDHPTRRFYLGTSAHVLCLDQDTGVRRWRTRVGFRFHSHSVTLLLQGGRVFAGCAGRVSCLDTNDGRILWAADTSRLGEPVALALDLTVPEGQLIAAGGGVVYSLSASRGTITWKDALPRLGFNPICLRVPGAITAQPLSRVITTGSAVHSEPWDDQQLGE